MSAADNRAALRRAIEGWNQGDREAYLKLYDSRAVLHGYQGVGPGLDGIRQFYGGFWSAFPSSRIDLDQVVAEGDKAACSFTLAGLHLGEFNGIPATGKQVAISGITVLRFANGQCVERWSQADFLGLLQQLGVIPSPAPQPSAQQHPGPDRQPVDSKARSRRASKASENKALVRWFFKEAQTRHKLAAVDRFLSPDFVDYSSAMYGTPPNRDGVKQFFQVLYAGLPDVRAITHDQVSEGDIVVTRKTLRGTHRGQFMGAPPTGKVISISVIDMLRVSGGKITGHWAAIDRLGLLTQLGLAPPAG